MSHGGHPARPTRRRGCSCFPPRVHLDEPTPSPAQRTGSSPGVSTTRPAARLRPPTGRHRRRRRSAPCAGSTPRPGAVRPISAVGVRDVAGRVLHGSVQRDQVELGDHGPSLRRHMLTRPPRSPQHLDASWAVTSVGVGSVFGLLGHLARRPQWWRLLPGLVVPTVIMIFTVSYPTGSDRIQPWPPTPRVDHRCGNDFRDVIAMATHATPTSHPVS